jgi:8-oxo-dGTP diphosphatase
MIHIVNGLLIRDAQVLMAHRAPSRTTYPDTWSFPGGHVEPGETLEQALLRELTEELAITAKTWAHLHRFTVDTTNAQQVTFHIFRVDHWDGTPTNIGTEHTELRWMTYDSAANLPALTFPNYVQILNTLGTG